MKKIFTLFILLGISNNTYANNLTIYTYDSFVSEWGAGPIVEKIFEEKFRTDIDFIAVDSAATLLNKIILEGSTTKADIVLGLDMNLLDKAEKSNLFEDHEIKNLEKKLELPINWESNKFVPYNYGYFSFVYKLTRFQ